jgi:phasin family protein
MNSFHTAASFPFANPDLSKAWFVPKLPTLNIEALLEANRKNAAALTNVNQVALDGLKTLVKRQGDLLKTTVDDYSKVTNEVLTSESFEERATKQTDAARHIYVSSVARFRELSDIVVKANLTAVDILNARVAEAFDEILALFAAPATAASGTRVAPTSAIAAPVPLVEKEAPVAAVLAPVEPEPTVDVAARTTAPKAPAPAPKGVVTTVPKTAAPDAKPARRPTSRN